MITTTSTQKRLCPYCLDTFYFASVRTSITVEMAHLLAWHAVVSLHIKECRAEWLSLIESEEKSWNRYE